MSTAYCTLISADTGAATPPGGGGVTSVAYANAVIWQVTAEIKGVNFPLNDGASLVTQVFLGTVLLTPLFNNGFLIGYADQGAYAINVPFLDELFSGEAPLTAPYEAYYLITEKYTNETGFGTDLVFPYPKAAEPFTLVRKVRPLSSGGPTQVVSSILV